MPHPEGYRALRLMESEKFVMSVIGFVAPTCPGAGIEERGDQGETIARNLRAMATSRACPRRGDPG